MTLGTDIHAALASTITMLTTEFGVEVLVREQAESRAADGSTVLLDRKAVGFNSPIPMILTPITQAQAAKEWGQESDVTVVALVSDAWRLLPSYRYTVTTGVLVGQVFAEVQRQPEPIGGIVQIGLRRVA